MPTTRQVNLPLWLDSIDGVLSAFATRILLSLAIIVSVLIVDMPPMGQYVFLAVFTVEAVLRGILLGWHVLHGHSRATQVIHFSIVLLATVSFIPMEGPGSTILLVGRFARLALLLTYWGPLARDFALIALERERLSQIVLVTGLTAALTGLGAAFLRLVALAGGDVYTSQDIHTDTGFFELLWWSFRQVLDPGNLVTSTSHLWVLLTSLLLTIGGLLLIAVLIGIGASLVEDLVRAERYRRVGLRQHTVVLNASEQSQLVLTNMTRYFTQVRWRKVAVHGSSSTRPAFLGPAQFRSFHYRSGLPGASATLIRLDVPSARRIAVLASGPDAEADADAVTTVLNTRRLNPEARIVVELNRPGNIPAALKAGQPAIVPVPARRLAALVLAQELVDPGRAGLLQSFVSLDGQEIYACIFGDRELAHIPGKIQLQASFSKIGQQIHQNFDCLLLGYFVDTDERSTPWLRDYSPVLNPPRDGPPPQICGLIALAPRFEVLKEAVEALIAQGLAPTPEPDVPVQALPLRPEPTRTLKNAIVLGFHEDTVELVGEILRIFPECEITIVGEDESDRSRMRSAFLAERTETGARFQAPAQKKIHLLNPDGSISGRVNIRVANRYADGLFRPNDTSGPVGSVFDYDAAILLAERGGDTTDPDAGATLGILKLMDEWKHEADWPLKQVVAEFGDSEKSRLLQQRVQDLELSSQFSFICTSTLRQNILSHSLFVPGLPPVLHNLMTAGEEEMLAYEPTTEAGSTTFGQLLLTLGKQRPPVIPLAVQLRSGPLVVNPRPTHPLVWKEVQTVYALSTVTKEDTAVEGDDRV